MEDIWTIGKGGGWFILSVPFSLRLNTYSGEDCISQRLLLLEAGDGV